MSWNRQSWLVYPGLTLDFGHLIIGDISLPKFLTDICSCCAWRTRLWDDQHWLLTACSWANGILSHLPLRGHPRMQNKMQKRQPFTRYLEMAQSISFGLALIPPTSQHIFHTLNGVPHLPAHSAPTQSSRIAIQWFILLWTCAVLSALPQSLLPDYKFDPAVLWLCHV